MENPADINRVGGQMAEEMPTAHRRVAASAPDMRRPL